MRAKINDAYKDKMEYEKKNKRIWKDSKTLLKDRMRTEYLNVWREFITKYKNELKVANEKKANWLINKWQWRKVVPEELRGIVIKDQDIPAEFSSDPRVYGGVELNNAEKELLELPPNFGSSIKYA